MIRMSRFLPVLISAMLVSTIFDPEVVVAEEPMPEALIRDSLQKGLKRVQAAAGNYPSYRDCFSCHHQTLPVMAMMASKQAGLEIDATTLELTVEFTKESFDFRREQLEEGRGIGGGAMTVSYGLWTFQEVSRLPDEVTEAMSAFLIKSQERTGRWRSSQGRPPLEGSHITATVLSAYGLQEFAPLHYQKFAKKAIDDGLSWLLDVNPKDQEDRNFRLLGLWLLNADQAAIEKARDLVLRSQREDGGWSQLETMESDSYATGQALTILRRTGLKPSDPAYQRGLRFLIETQEEDGSWFVETRARPIQTFFDNGDPHGKSQFISTSATCWAVTALAESLKD